MNQQNCVRGIPRDAGNRALGIKSPVERHGALHWLLDFGTIGPAIPGSRRRLERILYVGTHGGVVASLPASVAPPDYLASVATG